MARQMLSILTFVVASSFGWALPMGFAAAPVLQKDSAALYLAWAKIKTPTAGPTEPLGTYAAGCLTGAVAVPVDAPGYAGMRLSRNRLFAHPQMVNYLKDLSERLRQGKMPLLLIGDVSPPRGGPMPTGHNSHQIGLDVDLWLRMSRARPTTSERESWSATGYVIQRKKLKKSWSSTQVKMIAAAADSSEVARIFVSPAIKRYFCNQFPSAPWQYRLRPWWGHEEHIHVRLLCPAGAATCVNQAPLSPADNGCGTDLDWWFSKEADDNWTKISTDHTPRVFPDIPDACSDMPTRP